MLYITRGSSDKKYRIYIEGNSYNTAIGFSITITDYYLEVTGGPEETEVYINFQNPDGTIINTKIGDYANIPRGFNAFKNNDGNIVIEKVEADGVYFIGDTYFYWIPAEESDIEDVNAYYDSKITGARVRSSIRKYGGFWIANKLYNYAANFDKSWSEYSTVKGKNYYYSLVYTWQLKKAYEYFGADLLFPINNSFTRFWVAEKDGANMMKVAYRTSSSYEYESREKSSRSGDLAVLYIE